MISVDYLGCRTKVIAMNDKERLEFCAIPHIPDEFPVTGADEPGVLGGLVVDGGGGGGAVRVVQRVVRV